MANFSTIFKNDITSLGLSSSTRVYPTVNQLPLTDLVVGTVAYVQDTNRLYVSNGNGWYNIALLNTGAPVITGGFLSSYEFETDGTPIVITGAVSYPEGFPLTWSYEVTSGTLGDTAVITQDGNEFTLTPSTDDNDAGEFSITFTVSNGTDSDTEVCSFSLVFGPLLHTLDNPNAYDTSASDQFGRSIAVSGNYVIVGSNETDAGGQFSGKAFIFNATTGALLHTLNNPNPYGTSFADVFSYSIAIDGNYAIVSGHQEEDTAGGSSSGRAYIYNVTTGALVHTLNNPNAYGTSASDNFGWSVGISGNYAIVSAYTEDDAGGVDSGKVYIYNVTTGSLLRTIDNPNAYGTSASDNFGDKVAISGNYAIVGTKLEDDATGTNSGKAYIFNVTNGALLHTLNDANGYSTTNNDQFGTSVAISGNYALVATPLEDDVGGINSGKAYVYNVSTGALLRTIHNPNAYNTSLADRFGISAAMSGNYAIIGAYTEDDDGGADSGKAYIFDVTTGALVHTLDNPNAYDTSANDNFGLVVGISGNIAVVGAQYEDDAGGTQSGKAYVYSI